MPLKLVPDNTNIGFVKLRFIAFALTLLLTIGAAGLLAVRGLNLGVDFVGGLTMQVEFAQAPAIDTLRERVDRVGVATAPCRNSAMIAPSLSACRCRKATRARCSAWLARCAPRWRRIIRA